MKKFRTQILVLALISIIFHSCGAKRDRDDEPSPSNDKKPLQLESIKSKCADRRPCNGVLPSKEECNEEIDYALKNDLITQESADWIKANRCTPVITPRNIVAAFCPCES